MAQFHYELKTADCELLTSESRILKGFYLCVLHANKIPPHLGLVCNGFFFSSKATGKDERVPLNHLLQIVNKRMAATLFFELDPILTSEVEIAQQFKELPAVIGTNETCLTPIKKLLNAPESATHIGDLIKYLEQSNLVLARLALHLPRNFLGIPFYTIDDITKRIESLKHDKGQKSIP